MEDRRALKTKKAIYDAFIELLKKKDINKISISELSEKADIGRGTFYLHYRDIYDLYEQIENEIFEKMGSFYDNTILNIISMDIVKFVELMTEYIYEKGELFKIMLLTSRRMQKNNKFIEFFKEKEFEELNEELKLSSSKDSEVTEYKKVESLFIVAGVTGVLEEWIIEGMTKPPSDIKNDIQRILLKFLI